MSVFYPFAARLEFTSGPNSGKKCHIFVNTDASIHVEDWSLLQNWMDQNVTAFSDEFTILTLLFAARGHIKERSAEESNAIAIASAKGLEICAFEAPNKGTLN